MSNVWPLFGLLFGLTFVHGGGEGEDEGQVDQGCEEELNSV